MSENKYKIGDILMGDYPQAWEILAIGNTEVCLIDRPDLGTFYSAVCQPGQMRIKSEQWLDDKIPLTKSWFQVKNRMIKSLYFQWGDKIPCTFFNDLGEEYNLDLVYINEDGTYLANDGNTYNCCEIELHKSYEIIEAEREARIKDND